MKPPSLQALCLVGLAVTVSVDLLELRQLRAQVAALQAATQPLAAAAAPSRRLRSAAAAAAAAAAAPAAAAACDCLASPTSACCADPAQWTYSASDIDADLAMSCMGANTTMPLACGIRAACDDGTLDAAAAAAGSGSGSGSACSSPRFALLASVCHGTGWTMGCGHFATLCGTAGTRVHECLTDTALPALPLTSDAVADLASVCTAMGKMAGCDACHDVSGKAASCGTLAKGGATDATDTDGSLLGAWAKVCNVDSTMGGMGGCKPFAAMCAAQAGGAGSAGGWLAPLCVGCDCLADPTLACCAGGYAYPDSAANADLDAACSLGASGTLSDQHFGCAVRTQCQLASGSDGALSDPAVCSPFTLLGGVCANNAAAAGAAAGAAAPPPAACVHYATLCETAGTRVAQCASSPPLPGLLATADAVAEIQLLCNEMSAMEQCNWCTDSSGGPVNCYKLGGAGVVLSHNALAVLEGICSPANGMDTMPDCTAYLGMCAAQTEGGWGAATVCGSYAPKPPSPGPAPVPSRPFCTGATVMHMDGMHGDYSGSRADLCLVFFRPSWVLDSQAKLSGALFLSMLMGMANAVFARLRRRLNALAPLQRLGPPRERLRKARGFAAGAGPTSPFSHTCWGVGLADALALLLYTLQLTNAYALMLLVMTYYSGFFFSCVVGLALGQILFLRNDVPAETVDPCCQTGEGGEGKGKGKGGAYEPLLGASAEALVADADLVLRVDGMTCESCVGTVTQALTQLSAVASAAVRLADSDALGGRAFILGHAPLTQAQADQAVDAVEGVGFDASVVKPRSGGVRF